MSGTVGVVIVVAILGSVLTALYLISQGPDKRRRAEHQAKLTRDWNINHPIEPAAPPVNPVHSPTQTIHIDHSTVHIHGSDPPQGERR